MKLYTVQEVAMLLKVHPKTVKRYIAEHKLRGKWLGNRWRLEPEAVKEFIDSLEESE